MDTSLLFPGTNSPVPPDFPSNYSPNPASNRGRSPSISAVLQSTSPRNLSGLPTPPQDSTINMVAASVTAVPISAHRARRASAAEKALEQLRSRSELQKSSNLTGAGAGLVSTPRTSWIHFQQKDEAPSGNQIAVVASQDMPTGTQSRRQSLLAPIGPPASPVLAKSAALPPTTSAAVAIRPRPTWSTSAPQLSGVNTRPLPPEILGLLDGEHHTDELAVRFEAGWPVLEGWLVAVGGGRGDGDFGRVCMIYR